MTFQLFNSFLKVTVLIFRVAGNVEKLAPPPPSFEASDDLKACSGCLSVSYAGREEQKSHWKRHKAVCKVLKRFCGER